MRKKLFSLLLMLCCLPLAAQQHSPKNYVTIQTIPNHADWIYSVGESVTIDLAVMKDYFPQPNATVKYQWGEETLTPEEESEISTGGKGVKSLKLKGLSKPGFKTLIATTEVGGVEYKNYINVAFEPEKITPTVSMPDDFESFWSGVLEEYRKVPLRPRLTLMSELCTSESDAYHVRFCNGTNDYIYGILNVPKGALASDTKYPAVLCVPGAGARPYYGTDVYASKGVISLSIGIHGIPVNLDPELYTSLRNGALLNYNCYDYDNRDRHYYKRVYAGCVKSIDLLCSLPNVDVERVGVSGGSQGGLLSLVVAGLDKRVKYSVVNHPAYCNLNGYAAGSVGGWSKLFRDPNETNLKEKIAVSAYYDGTNFARLVTQPLYFSIGYNDNVCPPTSTMATYNVAGSSAKELHISNECGHWFYPEQTAAQQGWIIEQLTR